MITLNSTTSSRKNDNFALIHGPSHVTLTKGCMEVFGKIIEQGESFIVPYGKTTPVILRSETQLSDLQVKSGTGGALEHLTENPIPKLWGDLANQLIMTREALWMIIGGPDTGKTGLITFLVNQCLLKNRNTAIIDSDIGQSNIGPPTTIGLAMPSSPEIFLSNHPMKQGYFIGSTSPRSHLLQTCCGVRKLVDSAYDLGAEIVLLDTSGYIEGSAARALKYHKAVLIEPSSILALQRENELEHILTSLDSFAPIVRMDPPFSVQLKNHDIRGTYRETRFKKVFAGARSVTFSFKDVRLLGTALGYGTSITAYEKLVKLLNTKIIWAQKNSDRLLLVVQEQFSTQNLDLLKEEYNVKQIQFIFYRDLLGLIVGLLAENHTFLTVGLLQDIRFNEKIVIRTTVNKPEQVKFITLGRIQLTQDGKQIGRIPVGYL
ncbi:MAG: Clp1/GlmU family protein [Candidatus Heimdallarchaeota archaeon]